MRLLWCETEEMKEEAGRRRKRLLASLVDEEEENIALSEEEQRGADRGPLHLSISDELPIREPPGSPQTWQCREASKQSISHRPVARAGMTFCVPWCLVLGAWSADFRRCLPRETRPPGLAPLPINNPSVMRMSIQKKHTALLTKFDDEEERLLMDFERGVSLKATAETVEKCPGPLTYRIGSSAR
nr:hypothetical protein CFP56_66853 [Quercus suber]